MAFSNEFGGPGIRSILTRFSSYLRHWQSQRAPQMDPISPSPFIHPVSHSHPSFISLTHSHPVIHTVTHLSQNHPVWICFKMDIFDNMSSTAKLTDNLNCFFQDFVLNCGWVGVKSPKLFSENIQCLYGISDHSKVYYLFHEMES